jgi:lactobin A/cerein 7B family class IIb bacteriocin
MLKDIVMIHEMNENEIAEVSGGWVEIVAVAVTVAAAAYQFGKDVGEKLSNNCPAQT